MKGFRGSNGSVLVWIFLGAAVAAALGVRHVWTVQQDLVLRRAIHVELQQRRTLNARRNLLEAQEAELRASPRVRLHATGMGMRLPRPDEWILAGPDND
jgi:hypothetical protein